MPQQYARVEALAGLIDFLDLLEGDVEAEDSDGDCCAAGDDAPIADHVRDRLPGDLDDAEPEEDRGADEDEGARWSRSRAGTGCPVFDGI